MGQDAQMWPGLERLLVPGLFTKPFFSSSVHGGGGVGAVAGFGAPGVLGFESLGLGLLRQLSVLPLGGQQGRG